MTTPTPPSESLSSHPSPGRRRGALLPWVLAALFAVAAVVLGVLLVVGDDEVGSSAESSAAAACDLLEQVEPRALEALEGDSSEEDLEAVRILVDQLSAAHWLGELAEAQDAELAGDLAEAMREVQAVSVRLGSKQDRDLAGVVDDALGECDDL